jgi:RNA polymerase sigma factor (sigma-70 family)
MCGYVLAFAPGVLYKALMADFPDSHAAHPRADPFATTQRSLVLLARAGATP